LTVEKAVGMIPLMAATGSVHTRVDDIQRAIREQPGLDGWLFYDFRHSDLLSYGVLRLDVHAHVTRRWYYWVPAKGTPAKLVHAIESHVLDSLPGTCHCYVSWRNRHATLQHILLGAKRVAMQYSPCNAIPYVARVDAGTIDLVRSFGIEVVTSADLVQQFEAVWNETQLQSHCMAAAALRRIVDEAFGHVGRMVAQGKAFGEYDLQQFILSRFHQYGLVTSSPPIAAVNDHSADPHYSPTKESSRPIRSGGLVLIDLWAKQPDPDAVYADITWTGYVGGPVPDRHRQIFDIVRSARDAALAFVQRRIHERNFPCGWEVDDVCRQVIEKAGYGERFIHRTGHSIGVEVHGNGANIDNLETQDSRRLMPHTGFSIEPGIYLPGEFGVRSELDVYLSSHEAVVYGLPLQTEIVPIPVHAPLS
jgi:Xaa-Pro aminopeptidase